MNPSLKNYNDLYASLKGVLEASHAFREGRRPVPSAMRAGVGICGILGNSPLEEVEVNYFVSVLCKKFSQTGVARYPCKAPHRMSSDGLRHLLSCGEVG